MRPDANLLVHFVPLLAVGRGSCFESRSTHGAALYRAATRSGRCPRCSGRLAVAAAVKRFSEPSSSVSAPRWNVRVAPRFYVLDTFVMEKRNYESPKISVVGDLSNDTMATHVGIIYDGGPQPALHQTVAQAGSGS